MTRNRVGPIGLVAVLLGTWAYAAPIPPGRQHRLSIEAENTVTFLPQANLPPVKIDFKAKIEYIVNTRYGKETKPTLEDESADEPPPKEPVKKGSKKGKAKVADDPSRRITGAVDLALHSSEMAFRQGGQAILETRMSRSKFQGRMTPEAPVLNVSLAEAPPRLQEVLKNYDVVAASLLLNDDFQVVNRKYRFDGPQRAVIETLLSIHTPMPKGAESWESPTQLAMGHGQTARGKLRFEKLKATEGSPGDPVQVRVKVSGVLKAEGVVAGNFIKDGSYSVSGEQVYDLHNHEWTSSRWSVAVSNELSNPAGITVAHAKGTMIVESKPASGGVESASPKL